MPTTPDGTYSRYCSQAARDAQASGYGGDSYPAYLERSTLEHVAHYVAQGDLAGAQAMLTRSLGDSLAGNDGD